MIIIGNVFDHYFTKWVQNFLCTHETIYFDLRVLQLIGCFVRKLDCDLARHRYMYMAEGCVDLDSILYMSEDFEWEICCPFDEEI